MSTQTNNLGVPITTDSGSVATPYGFGAGEVATTGPLQPGVKTISSVIPNGFKCPKLQNANLISNFNGNESKNVVGTITNLGADDETNYTATVDLPTGLNVKVIPDKLQFTKISKKLSYQVSFISTSATTSPNQNMFGSIAWTNDKYRVQTPFVVRS
ncbi:unnamed protein product [Camellia sinensis]